MELIENRAIAGVYEGFYRYANGQFIALGQCRDAFANHPMSGKTHVGWACGGSIVGTSKHGYQECLNIKRLLEYCEKRLKLRRCSKYTCYYYGSHYLIIIDVAAFWRKSKIRMSLFSAIIKGGRKYSKGKRIRNLDYFNHTYPAFAKFLKGYTNINFSPDDYGLGWCDIFRYNHMLCYMKEEPKVKKKKR